MKDTRKTTGEKLKFYVLLQVRPAHRWDQKAYVVACFNMLQCKTVIRQDQYHCDTCFPKTWLQGYGIFRDIVDMNRKTVTRQ